MSFISKVFGRSMTSAPAPPAEGDLSRADNAIRLARQGRISIEEMLRQLVCSQLFVPLAAPPKMEGDSIKSWKPASVSKADRSQWIVAFTDAQLAAQFAKQNASYPYGICLDARWILHAVPPAHGLVVNVGAAESMFEWSADGLSQYKADVLAQTIS